MKNKKDIKKCQIISFLSGKGGAGKTSAAINVSHLLNDAGFRVLLVDFDFATNGASYFYKHYYSGQRGLMGLYDLIELRFVKKRPMGNISSCLLSIKKELCFIASRVNFTKKIPLRDSLLIKEEDLISFLNSIINTYEKDFDFIIIDNQAGSNLAAKASASVSNKVIIVSELDPISNSTVETLLIQIGDSFPEYRRYLINKLDIRESEEYKNLSQLFQAMNRLPPLPFDFDVRSAFASGRIPVDVEKPTTFLIALYNTVKAFLPEYLEKIEIYGEKILSKFNEYQERMTMLLNKKKELEIIIAEIRRKREKRRLKIIRILTFVGIYIGIGIIGTSAFGWKILNTTRFIPILIGAIIAVASFLYFFLSQWKYREKIEDIEIKENINKELSTIDKEIDRYESLMLTRTKEFLLNFEKEKVRNSVTR